MQPKQLKKIRTLVVFFSIMLALSGITAFPVYSELFTMLQPMCSNGTRFYFTGTTGWLLPTL